MNKQLSRLKVRRPYIIRLSLDLHASVRALILAGMVFVGGIGIVQQVEAAQTTSSYCAQYTQNSKLNACKDGIKGADCSDYAITFDQEHADICTNAAKAKASGQISDTPTVSVTPTPSASTSTSTSPSPSINVTAYKNTILAACSSYKNDTPSYNACLYGGSAQSGSTAATPKTNQDCLNNTEYKNSTNKQKACIAGSTAGQKYVTTQADKDSGAAANSNPFSFLDQLSQSQDLSQYVDTLHANGQDKNVDLSEKDDTDPGYYINGAGKHQPINVTPCPSGGKCPVILFFNGGGWHANDHTSDFVASGSPYRNGDPNQGDLGAPAGGGATQRGFTVIDVTYRLGSSGVYYMFEDVMRGIQHVISNADRYPIDSNKLAIWGDSAGGSLAMRAAASGKSGAKVAVGWSPPTNAYTGLFRSYKSLFIGIDHSTCAPTDLAGLTNFTDLLTGGSGDVAQYGQGLSSNDFSSIMGGSGDSNPLSLITEVLTAGQYAMQSGQNVESISKQLESGGISGLSGGVVNLTSKKFGECIDNFNALSPALFASPETPPSFLAGNELDDVVGPNQVYGMRDKLLSLGIRSEALELHGDPEQNNAGGAFGPNGNHFGYNPLFVCKSLNFVISVMNADQGKVDCGTGIAESQGSNDAVAGGGGGGTATNGGGAAGTPSGTNTSSNQASSNSNCGKAGASASSCSTASQSCTNQGGVGGSAGCNTSISSGKVCDTWQSTCNGGTKPTGTGSGLTTNRICTAPGQKFLAPLNGNGQGSCVASCPGGYSDGGTYCARITSGGF